MSKRKVLIDGDIVAYRSAFATQTKVFEFEYSKDDIKNKNFTVDPEYFNLGLKSFECPVFIEHLYSDPSDLAFDQEQNAPEPYGVKFEVSYLPEAAEEKFEILIDYILGQCLEFPSRNDYEVYLTGKNNFRHEIAKSHVYKGNRKESQKPLHLHHVREYAVNKFGAIVSEGEEADDLIAIEATKYGKQAIVASIDKDMLQIPCTHFNFNRNEWTDVDEWDGLRFFYTQILTGDSADNIVGLYKVGPVKAGKILDGAESEEELWDRCVDAYDDDAERVLENARLLWLRRYEGELWQPPDMR